MTVGGDVSEDDKSIGDTEELWRRIPFDHWVPDPDSGGRRISSAAFEDDKDGSPMSVVIAVECIGGLTTLLRGHDGFGAAMLTVAHVREKALGVKREPEDDLPGHAHVIGKKTKSVRRYLARVATLIREPVETRLNPPPRPE